MGGTVAVTIRRADGRTHRMARWTNPFSHVFMDLAFIEGDDSFWDEYIRQWDEKVYADLDPWEFTAPLSYGLIVVDYPSKTILHSQCYSCLDAVGFQFYLRDSIYSGDAPWPWPKIVDLSKSERVHRVLWDPSQKEWVDDGTVVSWEHETDRESDLNKKTATSYPVDLSPWTDQRFGEGPEAIQELKNRLSELNYVFSPQEEAAWTKFLDSFEEDEDEDEEEV